MLGHLKIKNYKSLENVDIPLRSLTVFVGPNNAGKSNILDCLLFLRELLEQGPPAVHSRGAFNTSFGAETSNDKSRSNWMPRYAIPPALNIRSPIG